MVNRPRWEEQTKTLSKTGTIKRIRELSFVPDRSVPEMQNLKTHYNNDVPRILAPLQSKRLAEGKEHARDARCYANLCKNVQRPGQHEDSLSKRRQHSAASNWLTSWIFTTSRRRSTSLSKLDKGNRKEFQHKAVGLEPGKLNAEKYYPLYEVHAVFEVHSKVKVTTVGPKRSTGQLLVRRQIALFALQGSIDWVHPTVRRFSGRGGRLCQETTAVSGPYNIRIRQLRLLSQLELDSHVYPTSLRNLVHFGQTGGERLRSIWLGQRFRQQARPENATSYQTFLQLYRPDMDPNTTFDLLSVDGGINNQLPCGAGFNGDLDIQYTVGMATGVPVTFISTETLPDNLLTEMLDQANYLLTLEHPPQTILDTIAGLESQGLTPNGNLAGRGTSYIVQTGIWRAGGIPFPPCNSFDPPFLASCLL
ncbi:hypothetical protein B0H14DRAFT_2619663 [Mycena olivaceomarginata]|nr:hypothetical protein B0H14DRAFT_2619663 [Mycena olivaceomarginata]